MRYAEIIRINEAGSGRRPLSREVADHLFELVTDFVTRGPITDEMMDEVMREWPRPAKGMRLWRVQVISKKQAAKLSSGLTLPAHRYLSWTMDQTAIQRLAAARTRGGGVPVIIEAEVPPERICIDVQEFVSQLMKLEEQQPDNFDFDFGALTDYADEAEVIVQHAGPLILNASNTKVFQAQQTIAPKVGDLVYQTHSMSMDGYPIEQVIRDNRNGTWLVKWFYGENDIHRLENGEWEVIDHYD